MAFFKNDFEVGFSIKNLTVSFCTRTDIFNVLPNISLWFGYLKGIYEGEAELNLSWLIFAIRIQYFH